MQVHQGWSIAQACRTIWSPMNFSYPGCSVYRIFLARMLEWVAFPSPRDLPNSGIKAASLALADWFFTTSTTLEAHNKYTFDTYIQMVLNFQWFNLWFLTLGWCKSSVHSALTVLWILTFSWGCDFRTILSSDCGWQQRAMTGGSRVIVRVNTPNNRSVPTQTFCFSLSQ